MYLSRDVPGSHAVDISLNGVKPKYALESDDTEGWVIVAREDANGRPIADGYGGLETDRLEGRVTFQWADDEARVEAEAVQVPNMREMMQFHKRIEEAKRTLRSYRLERHAAATGKSLREVIFDDIGRA